MSRKIHRRYSESFKREVITEVSTGRLTVSEARIKYDIPGNGTIPGWLRRYGVYDKLFGVQRIYTVSDVDKIKDLERRNQELEQALGKSHIETLFYKEMVALAEEHYGVDIKKLWAPTVYLLKNKQLVKSYIKVCEVIGKSYQAFHKAMRLRNAKQESTAHILNLVRMFRCTHPKMGCRKLLHLLQEDHDVHVGRDTFFTLMRENGLLIKQKKSYSYKRQDNGDSYYPSNIIKDITPKAPNHIWVSDITYLCVKNKHWYLSLVIDSHSRFIVGHNLSTDLCHERALAALKQGLRGLKAVPANLIHHSDRGVQYCCYAYRNYLTKKNIKISMTKGGSPHENAKAERVNGILKHEYNLVAVYEDPQKLKKAVEQAIQAYNYGRPHMALNYKTPYQEYSKGDDTQLNANKAQLRYSAMYGRA